MSTMLPELSRPRVKSGPWPSGRTINVNGAPSSVAMVTMDSLRSGIWPDAAPQPTNSIPTQVAVNAFLIALSWSDRPI